MRLTQKWLLRKRANEEIDQAKYGDSEKPLPLKVSIGRILSESETIQATEGLAVRLIERAKSLRASQPAVARRILRGIEGVSLPVVEINLVERIGAGWADLDSLKVALGEPRFITEERRRRALQSDQTGRIRGGCRRRDLEG